MSALGLGIGWRPPLASFVLRRPDLGFVEILAESFPADRPLPLALVEARRRGVAVVPHGLGLGLGGADLPDERRLERLGHLAQRVGAPLVSEHVAFVRAGGREAGHLLPIPRTRAALAVLVENVRIATAALPVPLALEPVASLFEWPVAEPAGSGGTDQLDEATFLTELVERTDALLLLDVANLYANARNHGYDPVALIDRLPLDRIAYLHVAGGAASGGIYHDTHAHDVPGPVLDLLAHVSSRTSVPGAMLERDDRFPPTPELNAELDAIAASAGASRWALSPPARRPNPRRRDEPGTTGHRATLAARQGELLRVLHQQMPVPFGFDACRIEAAAAALRCKRARIEPVPAS